MCKQLWSRNMIILIISRRSAIGAASRAPRRSPAAIPIAMVIKIHQRRVQWKQGVVIYVMLCASLLSNPTPIHCIPLPLHPPVMNTQVIGSAVGIAKTQASSRTTLGSRKPGRTLSRHVCIYRMLLLLLPLLWVLCVLLLLVLLLLVSLPLVVILVSLFVLFVLWGVFIAGSSDLGAIGGWKGSRGINYWELREMEWVSGVAKDLQGLGLSEGKMHYEGPRFPIPRWRTVLTFLTCILDNLYGARHDTHVYMFVPTPVVALTQWASHTPVHEHLVVVCCIWGTSTHTNIQGAHITSLSLFRLSW